MRDTIKQEPNHFFPGNKVLLHTLCFMGIMLLLLAPPLRAQSGTQSGAPLSFQDEKLSAVLQKISETNTLNFSYDANDPVFDQPVNYVSEGESVDEMLRNILSTAGLQHKQIGNQTVIFHAAQKAVVPVPETIIPENKPPPEAVEMNDNPVQLPEYILDTVFLHDTILRIDTLRVTDTIFIEKEKPQKQTPSKIKELPVDYFQMETNRDKGWAMGVFAAPVLDDFSLVKGQKSFSLRSFSLGVDVLRLLKRWNISFGIRLTQFNQRFTQQYSSSEGGVYATDTVDAYYTVIDFDTAWYYVTDSSWVPLEVREYDYQRTNTLGYLDLNVSASFDLYQSAKTRIYLKAGGQLDLLIYDNGLAILGDDQKKATDFDDMNFNKINYSVSAGFGLKYRIADQVDFNTEFYYMRYFNEVVTDFPESTRINAMGLKLGLVFYF